MRRFWIAIFIAVCVSSVHLAGEAEFRSPFISRLIDVFAVAAFPGTAMAQVLASMLGSSRIAGSLAYVFTVSIIFNTLFYWGALSLVAKLLPLNLSKSGQ
jgi:hypothetical protein